VTSKGDAPKTIEALDADVLRARRSVILAKRRARKLAKPLYINTKAAWQGGVAGLAYVSASLGDRTALVACGGQTEAEHHALLMAMVDAEECELPGNIEFRLDSGTLADLDAGRTPELVELRKRVIDMLARHPAWRLEWVERRRNWIASAPARRTLSQWENHADGS
jgi:hypothetical protein